MSLIEIYSIRTPVIPAKAGIQYNSHHSRDQGLY